MILNEHDKALLIALRTGDHFKNNPGDVSELLRGSFGDTGPSEGTSSARRLCAAGLTAFVTDSDAPGKTLLRITDTGIAAADNLISERRPKTFVEQIKSVPRSDWIAFMALIVSFFALFKGN
jgi:hypothetical protein